MLEWCTRPPGLLTRISQLALSELLSPGYGFDAVGANEQGAALLFSVGKAGCDTGLILFKADAIGTEPHHLLVQGAIQRPLHIGPAHHDTGSACCPGEVIYRDLNQGIATPGAKLIVMHFRAG